MTPSLSDASPIQSATRPFASQWAIACQSIHPSPLIHQSIALSRPQAPSRAAVIPVLTSGKLTPSNFTLSRMDRCGIATEEPADPKHVPPTRQWR